MARCGGDSCGCTCKNGTHMNTHLRCNNVWIAGSQAWIWMAPSHVKSVWTVLAAEWGPLKWLLNAGEASGEASLCVKGNRNTLLSCLHP